MEALLAPPSAAWQLCISIGSRIGARHITNAPHLASIRPPGTAECLSPVCISQWLALPQGLPNWCQAHDERINQWLALLQRLPNWCQAHHEDTALLLASAPRVTTKCLSPGRVSHWLALPQGPPNWCQAHDDHTALLLASVPQAPPSVCPQSASTNG